MSDDNEDIWLTYQVTLSKVEDEYAGKFDATETVKQWAVARRMYQKGREHAIQELIEKAEDERKRPRSPHHHPLRVDLAAEWLKDQLKSQMEGE